MPSNIIYLSDIEHIYSTFVYPPSHRYLWNSTTVSMNRDQGTTQPFYRKLISQGANATTNLTGFRQTLVWSPADAGMINTMAVNPKPPPPLAQCEITLNGTVTFPSWWAHTIASESEAESQALTRIYQDIKAQRTAWQGGTAIGEMRETIKLIRNSAKLIATKLPGYFASQLKLIEKYRSGHPLTGGSALFFPGRGRKGRRKRGGKDLARALADNYLTFTFGVRPLVKDTSDAAQSLGRWIYEDHRSKCTGYGRSEDLIAKSFYEASVENIAYNSNTRRIRRTEVKYNCGLRDAVSFSAPGSLKRLAELSGFTLEEFVPTVYNLIPWSFFLDYFVNVGDVLQATFMSLNDVTWIKRVGRHTITENWSGPARSTPTVDGKQSWYGTVGSYTATTCSFVRSATSSLPVLGFRFSIPEPSSLKWLNTTMLFLGTRGGRH